jgi:ABC-2 type transport system permease protein
MTGFVALLRRELWEHRSLMMVPATLAFLVLGAVLGATLYGHARGFGFDFAISNHFPHDVDPAEIGRFIPAACTAMAVFFGLLLAINVSLYLVDCLYSDRRDRSILFWKSLPISDTATVLSKLTTGLLVAPAIALAAALATTLILAVAATLVMWVNGVEQVSSVWQARPLLTGLLGLPLIALLLALWYAPIAAWCLLASAWAPRAPLLWASLPPVALIIVEQVAFHTSRVPEFLGDRLGGVFPRLFETREYRGLGVDDGDVHSDLPALHDVFGYLTSLDVWGGIAVAAVFTAAAIALRRYRDET